MRCVRPPLKLYSTAAPATVTLVCAGTLQVYSTWCRAYIYTAVVYSLRACTRQTCTRPYRGSRLRTIKNFRSTNVMVVGI
jgi:hypothetical protein